MSTFPGQHLLRFRDASASDIETVAGELVTLVEEFQGAMSEGQVPPDFAERLAEVRRTAEALIGR